MTAERVRLGEFEFTKAELPPGSRGRSASDVPKLALQALDQLKADAVLVISDVSTSWGSAKNTKAKEAGTPVKFVSRSTGNGKADIYAIRYDWNAS